MTPESRRPEFSRPERVDQIGERERAVMIEADADERAALSRRFGLVAIDRLAARFTLGRDAGGVAAAGRVEASVTQACSITGDPLAVDVDEAVTLRFVDDDAVGDEVELSPEAVDTLPIEDGAIDLGEAAAETLALALDPFPRGPGAAAALTEAGVLSEEEIAPTGALAGLKDLLKKGG